MWKKMIIHFKVVTRYMPGGAEENLRQYSQSPAGIRNVKVPVLFFKLSTTP
jgi:hypothetical protein